MKRALAILAAVAVLTPACTGTVSALAALEKWTADPATGSKICIMFWDDSEDALAAARWSGPAMDGKAEGRGTLQYVTRGKDGRETTAQGEAAMKAGKLDGKASLRWSDGTTYDGYYKEGLKDGKGIGRWPDGRVYEGDYKAGLPDGQGVLREADGRVFAGEFKNGWPDGKVLLRWPNGATYEGDYRQGQREGFGVVKDPTGKVVYSGQWKNDKPVQKAD